MIVLVEWRRGEVFAAGTAGDVRRLRDSESVCIDERADHSRDAAHFQM